MTWSARPTVPDCRLVDLVTKELPCEGEEWRVLPYSEDFRTQEHGAPAVGLSHRKLSPQRTVAALERLAYTQIVHQTLHMPLLRLTIDSSGHHRPNRLQMSLVVQRSADNGVSVRFELLRVEGVRLNFQWAILAHSACKPLRVGTPPVMLIQ